MQSRRDLFLLIGGAAIVGGCGSNDKQTTTTETTTIGGGTAVQSDIEILNSALDLENEAVAAYAAVAGLLKGRALTSAREFAEHEQEHVAALIEAIEDLGGKPNQPRNVDDYGFRALADADDALTFATEIENTAIAAYIDALPKLSSPELRATAASIVSNEAQHLSVLLGALDKPQVPDAFVVGRRS